MENGASWLEGWKSMKLSGISISFHIPKDISRHIPGNILMLSRGLKIAASLQKSCNLFLFDLITNS